MCSKSRSPVVVDLFATAPTKAPNAPFGSSPFVGGFDDEEDEKEEEAKDLVESRWCRIFGKNRSLGTDGWGLGFAPSRRSAVACPPRVSSATRVLHGEEEKVDIDVDRQSAAPPRRAANDDANDVDTEEHTPRCAIIFCWRDVFYL